MEIIKKIIGISLFVFFVAQSFGQLQLTRQNSLYRSYDFEKNGNYTNAINELRNIYKSDDYFINIRLGWLLYLSKQYEESERYYNIAIRLKPYAIEAKFGIVKPLSASNNWEGVKKQYLEILKIDPQNTLANYWLGVIHYNRKEYAISEKLFEKVVNLYPLDYDSAIMLAWTKLNVGKANEAKILFEHALLLRPNDNSAQSGLKQIK